MNKKLTGQIIKQNRVKGIIQSDSALIGDIAQKGETGVGLEFKWKGQELGIKREDEDEFQYVDLTSDGITKDIIVEKLGYEPANVDDLIGHINNTAVHVSIDEKKLIEQIPTKANKSDIPTKLSELHNDTDFVSEEHEIFTQINESINNIIDSYVTHTEFDSQMEKLEDLINDIDIPEVDLSHIEKDINMLKQDKLDKGEFEQAILNIQQQIDDLIIPTSLSELTNDIGYITVDEVPEVDLSDIYKSLANLEESILHKADEQYVKNEISRLEQLIDDIDIPDVDLQPIYDSLDELYKDKANLKYVKEEIDRLESQINSIDLSQYAKATDIPTSLSELTNDTGYITLEDIPEVDMSQIIDDLNNIKELLDGKADILYVEEQIKQLQSQIDNVPSLEPIYNDIEIIKKSILNLNNNKADINYVDEHISKIKNIIQSLDDIYVEQSVYKADLAHIDKQLQSKQDKLSYIPEDRAERGKADGYTPLNANSKIPLQYIPDTARQQTYVVDTIDEMYGLSNLIIGEKCFIVKDSDTYIWNGESWLVVSKAEWENINLDWENIKNRPQSTQESIDIAVDRSHTHDNIKQLNRVSDRMFDDIQQSNWHILSGKLHLDDKDREFISQIPNKADTVDVYDRVTIDNKLQDKASKRDVDNVIADTQHINDDIAKRLGAQIPRHSNADYNDFKETGFYFIGPMQTNCPPDLDLVSIYLTVVATDSNIYQRAVGYGAGKIAKRQYRNGVWDDWAYDLALTNDNIEHELGFKPISDKDVDNKITNKADKSEVPTKVGELENDKNYISEVEWSIIKNKPSTFQPDTHNHKAIEVLFNDGDTFEDKLSKGELKGQKGDKGDKGEQGEKGKDGTDATITKDKIVEELGYVPLTAEDLQPLEDKDIALENQINAKPDYSDIPNKVGQLENDKGYISQVEWNMIDNKPHTFKPSSHKHSEYLQKDGSDNEVTLGKGAMFETNFKNDNWSFINNYTGGGWARGLLNIKSKDKTNYLQIGGNGSGQNFTRLYIGRAWNDWVFSLNPNNRVVDIDGDLRVNNTHVALKTDINKLTEALNNLASKLESFETEQQAYDGNVDSLTNNGRYGIGSNATNTPASQKWENSADEQYLKNGVGFIEVARHPLGGILQLYYKLHNPNIRYVRTKIGNEWSLWSMLGGFGN